MIAKTSLSACGIFMKKSPRFGQRDEYSDQVTARRRDAVIKRMLNTPPQPHSEMKIGKPRAKRGKSLETKSERINNTRMGPASSGSNISGDRTCVALSKGR